MDDDIADKIILLQVVKRPMPMPTGTDAERELFWNTLVQELPAFLWYIPREWQIPAWLLKDGFSQRYGIDSYKDPEILDALSDLAPETHFEKLFDETFTQAALLEPDSAKREQ